MDKRREWVKGYIHDTEFQAIINKILRNLINTRKVASFTNNIIVGTEEKEEHDKVVKKVVKRLEKDLMESRWKRRR